MGWSSTCNTVGQSCGWFFGNVVFLTLESADFCNKHIRPYLGLENQTYGVVTFKSTLIKSRKNERQMLLLIFSSSFKILCIFSVSYSVSVHQNAL